MDVYFVRHGETTYNARSTHQPPNIPLNEKGRVQALSAAESLRPMNVDYILTSDYTRAKETANTIGRILDIQPVENTLFHEVRRPAQLYCKSHFHPLTLWYVIQTLLHRSNESWHFEDAESLVDVRERVHKALEYLESLSGKHTSIVVVSHTIFVNLLVAYMCNNRTLKLQDLLPHLLHIARMKNGSIIHLKYHGDTKEGTCSWEKLSVGAE